MSRVSMNDRYSRIAILLHWLIAFLIIGQLAGGIYMHKFASGLQKFELYQWHKSFGIVVLLLSLARLGWRLTHKAPPLPEGMKPFERFAAKGTHIGFYFMMIGVPLAGWAMVSSSPLGLETKLFKVIPWPHIPGIEVSDVLTQRFKNIHEILAKLTIALIVLHIAAALKHHYVNKDTILMRMIPFLKHKG